MKRRLNRSGYTLLEVLTAAVLVGVGVAAAVSMSSTMLIQEELAWRVSVGLNYQDNACRLWQLGLSPTEVNNLLPDPGHNKRLQLVVQSPGIGFAPAAASAYQMEGVTCTVSLNNFQGADTGGTTAINVYRPVTRGTSYEP